jgi:hypothetical protein
VREAATTARGMSVSTFYLGHGPPFQSISEAQQDNTGSKAPVPRGVGHSSVHFNVTAGEVRELLAGYGNDSAVGP